MKTKTSATKQVLRALRSHRPPRRSASEYVRDAIQTLSNVLQLGGLDASNRRDVQSANKRLWLAMRELEQRNP